MPAQRRLEKINMLLKEVLSEILDREIEYPPGVLVTITRVVTSTDGHYTTAFLSVLGKTQSNSTGDADVDASATILILLGRNIYHIQQRVNRTLRMRPIPKITFAIDKGEERRENVERTLAAIRPSIEKS